MSDVEKIGSAGIPLNIVDANGRKIMGDAYDNTAVYAVGDYCISGDHAYKCTTEIEIPEDFNTNHWQQITIEEILKEHDASIELVNSSLTQLLEWKYIDSFTGQTSKEFNPPTGYSELYVEVNINASNNIVSAVIPKHAVLRGGWIRSGGWGTANSTACLGVFNFSMQGTKIHIGLNSACLFGTDYTSNSTVNIYYR